MAGDVSPVAMFPTGGFILNLIFNVNIKILGLYFLSVYVHKRDGPSPLKEADSSWKAGRRGLKRGIYWCQWANTTLRMKAAHKKHICHIPHFRDPKGTFLKKVKMLIFFQREQISVVSQ